MRAVGGAGADRASVMMLMPAAVVIVLLLGAIAVDSAIVYLEQRQAYNVAFDAANDAVGGALSGTAIRGGTGAEDEADIDPARAQEIAASAIAASHNDNIRLQEVAVGDDGAVSVTVAVEVRRLFGQAFGADRRTTLTVTATAGGETRSPG